MTVETKEIVTIVAYLIGVRKPLLESFYPEYAEILHKLYEDKNATIIRYLCKVRSELMKNYKRVDQAILYDLKNIDTLEYFDQENIKQLEKWGVSVIRWNYRAEKYLRDITGLINENIKNCASLFKDWVKWDYIKDLFYIPKYDRPEIMKKQYDQYKLNINYYPFNLYIHWEPIDAGGILYSDRKFLDIIYGQHKDVFTDRTKLRDADANTKNTICEFIESSEKIAIAVDCENSNPFKLYSVLKGLSSESLSRIEKISLYDDSNTTSGWKWITALTKVPSEHVDIGRVVNRKSLVDISMTAGVCKDYYKNGITSFIVVSSDSDFWGLITSIPEAKFLVMYEYEGCSDSLKARLSENDIYYCAIDDFCTTDVNELKKLTLFEELEKHLPNIYGLNAMELTESLYRTTKIIASEREKAAFCEKYVNTLKLKINAKGEFEIEIKK